MFGWRLVRVAKVYYELPVFVPIAMQVHAHELIEAGEWRKAVRFLAKQAQLRRAEAKAAASTLRAGDVLPDFPMPWKADLAVRVRELLAAGHRKEAIFTVRSEQSMGTAEAEVYLDSL